jgi:mannose-6-phosphate isomerase-like protein (cupin superfamily)
MKFSSLDSLPLEPVSHDPKIKKKVLVGLGTLPRIKTISHIELNPGDRASRHRHENAYEVFYGIKGRVDFLVADAPVSLTGGCCLVVEPGEEHSIEGAAEGSRMLYFLLYADGPSPQ